MPSISGSASAIFNYAIIVVAVVAGLTPSMFPDFIPPGTVKAVIQSCATLTAIICGVNAGLHKAGGNGVSS